MSGGSFDHDLAGIVDSQGVRWDATTGALVPVNLNAVEAECLEMQPSDTIVDDALHNAFPSICPIDGGVLISYRVGSDHITSRDGSIYTRKSTDGQLTWSSPALVLDDAGTFDFRDGLLTQLSDGTLRMVAVRRTNSTGVFDNRVYQSVDNGDTWTFLGSVSSSFTGDFFTGGHIFEMPNGDLVVPVFGKDTGDPDNSTRVSKSTDGGTTWVHLGDIADGPADGRSYSEAGFFLAVNGDLVVLVRDDTSGGGLGLQYQRAVSSDSGATWSALVLAIGQAGGRPSPIVRSDGVVVVAFRDRTNAFPSTPTRMAVSDDNGVSWDKCDPLAPTTGRNSTYGAMVEDITGQLVIVYGDEDSTQSDSDINIAVEEPLHEHYERDIVNLGMYPNATGQPAGKVAETDGADGWTFIDTPTGSGGTHVVPIANGDPDSPAYLFTSDGDGLYVETSNP